MNRFFSCDWGTSSFRLRLVNADSGQVIEETRSDEGIASTYQSWQISGLDRLTFYGNILSSYVEKMAAQAKEDIRHLPVLISGMASSRIGLKELPYTSLPAHASTTGLLTEKVEINSPGISTIMLVSGIRSSSDVMRGEETILAGCNIIDSPDQQVFIFPGTHSKHIFVQNQTIKDFKTYMTGEFFNLLSEKSILAASVLKQEDKNVNDSSGFFSKGVITGMNENLLHASFLTRTNQLFNKNTPVENYEFLSGILIGSEVKELEKNDHAAVLVTTGKFRSRYLEALKIVHPSKMISFIDSDTALLRGHCRIYHNYK